MNIVVSINKLFNNAYKALRRADKSSKKSDQSHQVDSDIMKSSLILGRTKGYSDFLPDKTWKWYSKSDKTN